MLKRILSLGAAALAGVLGACEDGPATVAGSWRSPATWSSLVYATGEGPLWLAVHGDPFAAGPAFRAAVAEAMSGQTPSRPFRLTADRDQAPRPQFRVVVAFDPPPELDPNQLCTGPVPTATPGVSGGGGEKVTVLAAFCQDETLLAWVRGWAKAAGPDDRRFRRLLGQVARDLFGPQQP